LAAKSFSKSALVRPRRRWEDIIKLNLLEVWCKSGRQIALTQDRVQLQALKLTVLEPSGSTARA